jgi:23S rRNA (uracil1939-C5)-methyltransferase
VNLNIEKLVYGGDGLARNDGQVVFTPFVLPGETVAVEPELARSGVLRARLIAVNGPSPERVTAPCPYFGRCGGCHYQHATYQAQLRWKREILVETLRRVGKISPPDDVAIIAGEPWAYRNRSQFHYSDRQIGYLEARSRKLCAIDRCPISSPKVNESIAAIREMMRDSRWPHFVRSLEVFTNENAVQWNVLESERPVAQRFFDWAAERVSGFASGAIEYPAAGFTFRVGHGSFFQVNRFLLDDLVAVALNGAEGETALDLYAGVGLFSLPLARGFRAVTAVESGAGAVRDLQFNAARADFSIRTELSGVAEYLAQSTERPDFVLADPPRSGLGKLAVTRLIELLPRQIAIVACDPATLGRDLAALLGGGYRLTQLTMIDLFPQTFHIEAVAKLTAA